MPGAEIRRAVPRIEGITRLESRRNRRRDLRKWRYRDPQWQDRYPWVMGTFPEKLVFAWLADRGVPFTFQATFPDLEDTETVEEFRPDFLLEQFRVIIEVQGEYWHSLPDQAEHDAYKFACYEYAGYTVYWFWESDILTNLVGLMSSVTELSGWQGHEPWVWENQMDDLAGLRTTNARSRRPSLPALGFRGGGRIRT